MSIGEGEGEGERSSGEVGCIEACDRGPSKQLAMSLSKSALELKGKERGGIIGYSASSSPPTSTSRSASNRKVSDSEESEQALVKSRSSSSVSKMQSAGMLERGGGLQGEAGVCVTREWKDLGALGRVRRGGSRHWKGKKRLMKFFLLCRLETGGKAGESGEVEDGVRGSDLEWQIGLRDTNSNSRHEGFCMGKGERGVSGFSGVPLYIRFAFTGFVE